MPDCVSHDVVILGAGAAGLWLARELGQRRIPCVLIDTSPIAQYASTRNQGWLQSGAYFAAAGSQEVASDCHDGFNIIQEYAADAILDSVPAHLVFTRPRQYTLAQQACAQLGIAVSEVNPHAVVRAHPILRDPDDDEWFVLSCPDRPVDNSRVLSKLASEVDSLGGRFVAVSNLSAVSIVRDAQWRIDVGSTLSIHCRVLVLACGALIPSKLKMAGCALERKLDVTHARVLVVQQPICSSLLSMPRLRGFPNLVPIVRNGVYGANICLNGFDDGPGDEDDTGSWAESGELRTAVRHFYPGLSSLRGATRPRAHLYTCQQLRWLEDGPLGYYRKVIVNNADDQDDPLPGLITLYPGKFTMAPIAAREAAFYVESQLDHAPPQVAEQPYFRHTNQLLDLDGLDLEIDP